MSTRIGNAFVDLIERVLGPRVDAAATYRARVVAQSTDLERLDVLPDAAKLPGLSGVLISHTIPGLTCKVSVGSYCHVRFLDGTMASPRVVGFESGALESITITSTGAVTLDAPEVLLADGRRALACVGDPVVVSGIAVAGSPPIILGNAGGPVTGTITLAGQILPGGQIKAKA